MINIGFLFHNAGDMNAQPVGEEGPHVYIFISLYL
jgi:hypothetical protein